MAKEEMQNKLLELAENGLKSLNSMTSGIGLESERQNKAAFRKMLQEAKAAALSA